MILHLLLVLAAGFAAGLINAVVGSGTLITYPLLLSLGLSPIGANATNNVGLSPAGFSAAWAARTELRPRLRSLGLAMVLTLAGAATGALLVVALPERVFQMVVPWLILSAVVLVGLQPLISKRLQRRARHVDHVAKDLPIWTGLVGVYGGYFGAGQGVMYIAALGLRYSDDVRLNVAVKNLLAGIANATAAIVFILSGFVYWPFALCLALGSLLGGYAGGQSARRMHPLLLRAIVIAVGLYAAIYLLVAY